MEEFYNSRGQLGSRHSAIPEAPLAGRAATFAGKEGNGEGNPRILTM